jgi:hypothetical protein
MQIHNLQQIVISDYLLLRIDAWWNKILNIFFTLWVRQTSLEVSELL